MTSDTAVENGEMPDGLIFAASGGDAKTKKVEVMTELTASSAPAEVAGGATAATPPPASLDLDRLRDDVIRGSPLVLHVLEHFARNRGTLLPAKALSERLFRQVHHRRTRAACR